MADGRWGDVGQQLWKKELRPNRSLLSKGVPVLGLYSAAEYRLNLPQEHTELRHRILRIRGDGLAAASVNHEIVAGATNRPVESERAQTADKLTPLDWLPPGHGGG
jgi:hypothetical protein